MRKLNFIVNNQIMTKDPKCDWTGIVRGTVGYLQANFQISSDEWKGCAIAAEFTSGHKTEHAPIINGKCTIPSEILTRSRFKVKLIGVKDNYKITTNEVEVRQDG